MKFGHNIPEISKKKNRDQNFEFLIFGRSGGQKPKFWSGGYRKNTLKSSKMKKSKFWSLFFFLLSSGILCPNFIKIPLKLKEEIDF